MNRRNFITLGAKTVVSVGMLSKGLYSCKSTQPSLPQLTSVEKGQIQSIRGNVSRFNMRGGTIGVLETDDGFAIIDSQFPETVQYLLDSISQISGKSVQFLCNTHHHGDHTAGNITFSDLGCKTIAQEQVPIYQKIRAEENNQTNQQLYATTLFSDELSFELGKQTVKAYHYGAGHTYGDAVYHFEKENVIHVGDLVFKNLLPVYRAKDGSNAQNWAEILGKILDQFSNDSIFIFGHADQEQLTQGTKEDIKDMQQFMMDVHEFAEKVIVQQQLTVEQITDEYSFIPGHENRKEIWDGQWNNFISNLVETTNQS